MKSQTISDMFHACSRLERATEAASGNDALSEGEAQVLISQINTLAVLAETAVVLKRAEEHQARIKASGVTHDQATWMDSTFGHHTGGH